MSYWEKRFLALEEAQYNKSAKTKREIEKQFEKAIINIQKEINVWYARYATENNISMAEAKKILNTKELQEFRWSVEEYIEKGKENAISGEWTKELERASVRVHITRFEALKLQMQQQCEVAFGNTVDTLDKHLKDTFSDSYLNTAFEIQKGIGVGYNFAMLDDDLIDKYVSKPWAVDGKNFSKRVWGDYRPKLVNILNNDLTQAIIRGDDLQEVINKIAKECNVTKKVAGRLVMTESAYFSSVATMESYKKSNIKEFEILATLDSITCSKCGDLDGEHRPLTEYIAGVTAPPLHIGCRCTTVPYYDDMDDLVERIARDNEGETYEIDENITFNQWKDTFVDGGSKEEFKKKNTENRGDIKESFSKKLVNIKNSSIMMLSGLSANDKIGKYTNIPPDFLGKIDFNDEKIVNEQIKSFEDNAIYEKVETALVITEEGEVYKCYGESRSVYPDEDLGDKLIGAIVSHNHPIEETEYTFSDRDLNLFKNYNLKVLRGCDEKYIYEFTKNADDIDDYLNLDIDELNDELCRHFMMIDIAKENEVGYRRWENDKGRS